MIIFIIPAYNEEENIESLLLKTSQFMATKRLEYKLVIVNDGSSDNTLEKIESLKKKIPIQIYSHYPNKGVGPTFKEGFSRVLADCKDEDIIVTKEADNTSDLGILDELIAKIDSGNDVVLASCYAKEGRVEGTTLFRIICSRGANFLLKLFIPIKGVNTYSSFYRAYRAKALRELTHIYKGGMIEEKGFECMVELLIKFARNKKFKIVEVPLILDGSKRSGKSKMKLFKTIKGFLRLIVKSMFY